MPQSSGIDSTTDNIFDNTIDHIPAAAIAAEILNLIEKMKKEWNNYEFKNDNLWKIYFDYFERYTEEDFNLVDKNKLREFRSYLKKREVWVQIKPRVSCSTALANTLKKDKPNDWIENELKRCYRKRFISLELLDRIERIKKTTDEIPSTSLSRPPPQPTAPNLQTSQQQPPQPSRQFTSLTSQPQQLPRQLAASTPPASTYAAATPAIPQPAVSLQQFAPSYVAAPDPAAPGPAAPGPAAPGPVSGTTFILAAILNPKTFQAVPHIESFHIVSGCTFYKKRMG